MILIPPLNPPRVVFNSFYHLVEVVFTHPSSDVQITFLVSSPTIYTSSFLNYLATLASLARAREACRNSAGALVRVNTRSDDVLGADAVVAKVQ